MIDLVGWVALAATCIAAIVTAANLGARITGYGFAIFFVGAIAWCVLGAATGQRQLLWSNAFLAIVDLLGMWRWLYRRARAEDAVATIKDQSDEAREKLFALENLVGKAVLDKRGKTLAVIEGALADCATGALDSLVIRPASAKTGDATFKKLPWNECGAVKDRGVTTRLDNHDIAALPATV